MSERNYEIVLKMTHLLVYRLKLNNPTITYKELAHRLNTNYRKLGQPLLKMAEILQQCPVDKNIPPLNAMIVYSATHLPSLAGLRTACPGMNINGRNLRRAMEEMNRRAQDFTKWDEVLMSIKKESEENGKDIIRNVQVH